MSQAQSYFRMKMPCNFQTYWMPGWFKHNDAKRTLRKNYERYFIHDNYTLPERPFEAKLKVM